MTKILNLALKIKGRGREGGTCEVLRSCHPPPKKIGTFTSSVGRASDCSSESCRFGRYKTSLTQLVECQPHERKAVGSIPRGMSCF